MPPNIPRRGNQPVRCRVEHVLFGLEVIIIIRHLLHPDQSP
jgi:hypothetical protein